MMLQQNKYLFIGLIVSVAVMIGVGFFAITKKPTIDYKHIEAVYDKLYEAKQETIDLLKQENKSLQEERKMEQSKDSILLTALMDNRAKYSTNEKKYKAISPVVADYSKEQLRSELAGYK